MGVEYNANYGVGFKVKMIDFEDDSLDKETKELECMNELLWDRFDNSKESRYSWFEVGNNYESGGKEEFYIIVNDYSLEKSNYEKEKNDLITYMASIGLEPDGGFWVVGGLHIY